MMLLFGSNVCVSISSIHINQNMHEKFPYDVTMTLYTSSGKRKKENEKFVFHIKILEISDFQRVCEKKI